MHTPVKRLSASWVLVLGAVAAGAVAASDPVPLPQPLAGAAATAVEVAESAGREAEQRKNAPRYRGDSLPGATTGSRLLRSLSEQTAGPASAPPTAAADPADPGRSVAGGPVSGVLHGCPRALLSELLAGATETDDAVSALAIERETLALCRERQEIVTGIVMLEGELSALLGGWSDDAAGFRGAPAGLASPPIVKESTPIRVVRRMPVPEEATGASSQAASPKHGPTTPDYSWFSIIGMAGALQAGVSDGDLVWFVREGDHLPGGVLVTGIGTRPPGVSVGGAGEASLPYVPRSGDARLPARGSAGVDWSAAPGGSAAGGGQ